MMELYGSLFDAGVLNFVLPTRMISNGRMTSKKLTLIACMDQHVIALIL